MNSNWKPAPQDIAWQENLVRAFREGGVWGTSAGIWKIYGSQKKAVLSARTGNENLEGQITKVFKAMGWTVENGDEVSARDGSGKYGV